MTPNEWLTTYTRRYPQAWALAEDFRRDRGRDGQPDWPEWCYLPMGAWYAIICMHLGLERLSVREADDIACLAALGAWRYTQGVYVFHPALHEALTKTPISGELPADVLLRLPQWGLYVAGLPESPIPPFFVYLEHDANDGRHEQRFVCNQGDRLYNSPIVHIGNWSVDEGVMRAVAEAKRQGPEYAFLFDGEVAEQMAWMAEKMVCLVLYLCSEEPEIAGHEPQARPHYSQAVKTKRGLKFFPPDKPRVWRIGEAIGEQLTREYTPRETKTGRKSPRPHFRRAHFQGVWSGPLKPKPGLPPEQQARKFTYHWFPPRLIAADDVDDG